MATTTYMTLKTWTSTSDLFSHTDLANNFVAVDAHDHTTGKGVQIPAGGLASNAVSTAKVADGAITVAKLASAVTTDYGYAYSTYKEIVKVQSNFGQGTGSGTFVVADAKAPSAATDAAYALFRLDPADYAAGTRTTKYRVKVALFTNATAVAANLTFGLYPITATAGASALQVGTTLGTVVTGSTVLFTAPAGSSQLAATSGDFTAPAAGPFTIGLVTSTSLATSSGVSARITLQVRQV